MRNITRKFLSAVLAFAIMTIAFVGIVVPVSAETPDGTILLNEKMLYEQQRQGEKTFAIKSYNGADLPAETAANAEWSNGKLVLTADTSTSTGTGTWFYLPDVPVNLETFTWQVTFKTTNNTGSGRFQTGVRTAGYMNSWDKGTLIRVLRSG